MADQQQGLQARLPVRGRLTLIGLAGVVAAALAGVWGVSQESGASSPAVMLERDEELPEALPELPAEITYGERQDILPPMVTVEPATAADLQETFGTLDYAWPPEDGVPALSVAAFPSLGEMDVAERKALFFRSLLPLIVAENQIMLRTREQIGAIFADGEVAPDSREARFLTTLGERFRVDGDPNSDSFRSELLRRVDAVPASMALAQAANESGWGRSRFTREANNLFGVWTWHEDRGLVPEQRAEGATHFVRVFPDLRASVRNYLYTINVGSAYDELRRRRAQQRAAGDGLSGVDLAAGLEAYSERGADYVEEIQGMIRFNDLQRATGRTLEPVDARQLLGGPVEEQP